LVGMGVQIIPYPSPIPLVPLIPVPYSYGNLVSLGSEGDGCSGRWWDNGGVIPLPTFHTHQLHVPHLNDDCLYIPVP